MVCVAVLTFRRPESLGAMLPVVAEQARGLAGTNPLVHCTVLVVDNDETGSAAPVVEATPGVRHVVEGRPGIPAARNKALSESGGARLLVFIDDDECPSEGAGWSLVGCWLEHRPGRGGRAGAHRVPRGDRPLGRDGGFFDRRTPAPGHGSPGATRGDEQPAARPRRARRLGLRFDERFGITGG